MAPAGRQTRNDMIQRQVAARGVRDRQVLRAMAEVDRRDFVPHQLVEFAYEDSPLPIDEQQTISQPYIVAKQTELLELNEQSRVLEIGAGSGYQTAVLARVAGRIYAIERIGDLARRAHAMLSGLRLFNATVKCFDGTYGWSEFAPYHGVLVAAAGPEVPPPLVAQLTVGGHLVMPVGDEKEQRLIRITRTPTGTHIEDHGRCAFVKLIGKYGWER